MFGEQPSMAHGQTCSLQLIYKNAQCKQAQTANDGFLKFQSNLNSDTDLYICEEKTNIWKLIVPH